jgi:hypothetical protein
MFKIVSKIFIIPLLKYVLLRYAKKSIEGKLIFNTLNSLIFLGFFGILFAQALAWVTFGQSFFSSFLGAAAMLTTSSQDSAIRMINNEEFAAIQALNRYQIAPVIVESTSAGFSFLTYRIAFLAALMTAGVIYGFCVQQGWVSPIFTLVKTAVFGSSKTETLTTEEIKNIVKKQVDAATDNLKGAVVENLKKSSENISINPFDKPEEIPLQNPFDAPVNQIKETIIESSPLLSKAAAIDKTVEASAELIKSKPGVATTTAVLSVLSAGFVFQNADKFIKVGELAALFVSLLGPKTTLAATIGSFAATICAKYIGLGSFFVSADDTEDKIIDIFITRYKKYKDLLDKDYDEIIKHFREKGKN